MIITLKIGTENIKEFERMKEMNKELLSEPQVRELKVKLEPRRGAKVAPNTQEFSGRYPEKSANLVALLRYLWDSVNFGWERRGVVNVAIVQVLPVSISNFQWGRRGKLTIDSIGIVNIITLSTETPHYMHRSNDTKPTPKGELLGVDFLKNTKPPLTTCV